MPTSHLAKLSRLASYVLAGVLVLMPFYAFITVAAGTLTGHYQLVRLWKEVVLLALFPVALVLIAKTPGLWQRLRSSWLIWCMAAYAALHLALGAVALLKGQVNYYALADALVINLRLMLVFVIAYALAARGPWLHDNWRRILLWPAVGVVAFAMLQLFVLPVDFLAHFGYGRATIMPFETVDQKLGYIRIQSTLRGSNPLGAYLVLVMAALTVVLLRKTKDRQQVAGVFFFSACLVALMATYSRSAYIGAVVACLAAVWLVLRSRQARLRLAAGLAVFVLVAASLALVLRQNDRFQNTFLHTDEHSASAVSSDQNHASALRAGVSDVLHEPFGRGPGTAGPASEHNNRPARIAEDYYLQIGQEAGWLGLGLFLAINLLLARQLWQRRSDVLARVLLASLAGIAVINLILHAWADDTLAIVWWGMAGIAVAPVLSPRPARQSGRPSGMPARKGRKHMRRVA